jgi:hypothetical protein
MQNGQKRKASQHTITYRPNMGLERKSHHWHQKMSIKCYFTLWKTFYEDKHNFPVELWVTL